MAVGHQVRRSMIASPCMSQAGPLPRDERALDWPARVTHPSREGRSLRPSDCSRCWHGPHRGRCVVVLNGNVLRATTRQCLTTSLCSLEPALTDMSAPPMSSRAILDFRTALTQAFRRYWTLGRVTWSTTGTLSGTRELRPPINEQGWMLKFVT